MTIAEDTLCHPDLAAALISAIAWLAEAFPGDLAARPDLAESAGQPGALASARSAGI